MSQEKIKVTDKQISIILKEESRMEHVTSNFLWTKMTKSLNAEGPCIKSATEWKQASLKAIKLKFIPTN